MRNHAITTMVAAGLWLALVANAGGATSGEELRLLLLGVQDMNTPQTLLRADIEIELETPERTSKTDAIALFAPGKEARWYVQVREPALRSLVLGSERKAMERVSGTTQTVPIGAPLDALGIAYEDLSRFVVDDFGFWQITDEGAATILVGMHPKAESAYVYRAYSFDKEKKVPLRVQFYAKTLNNLVKLRTDSAHVLVGKKWLPSTIELRDYAQNSTTRLRLRWSQNATAPPDLLVPESFAGAPELAWSDAGRAEASARPTP